jgi:hypothetical protein
MWPIVGAVALGTLIVGQASRGTGRGQPSSGRLIRPRAQVAAVPSICVTRGALLSGGQVVAPTFRGVAVGTSGEAGVVDFIYDGESQGSRALASGQVRRQIGVKLRAMDGCNLVYAMWRLDPSPEVEVSVKINPGARTHAECGARGYTKIQPDYRGPLPTLTVGSRHWMWAEIFGDLLTIWIDDQIAWRGNLPAEARTVSGPSGLRSDNISYRILGYYAPRGGSGAVVPRCVHDGED